MSKLIERIAHITGINIKEVAKALENFNPDRNAQRHANEIAAIKQEYSTAMSKEDKESVLVAWFDLCETSDEIKDPYSRAEEETEVRRIGTEKWDRLSCKEIEQAQGLTGALSALKSARPKSYVQKLGIQKVARFFL